MASQPVFDKTCRVALEELSVGTILEAPEHPAPPVRHEGAKHQWKKDPSG
jgi:hypothetical protein